MQSSRVPARYRLANKSKPLGLFFSTPRKVMTVIKVAKKNTITLIPRLQENIRLSRLFVKLLPSSSTRFPVSTSSDLLLARVEGLRTMELGGTISLISTASTGSSPPLPSSTFGLRLLISFFPHAESKKIVAVPPANMRTGKYHSALYNMPAEAPRKTKTLVSLSVMAFCDSWTAARATIPTVAALRPVNKA